MKSVNVFWLFGLLLVFLTSCLTKAVVTNKDNEFAKQITVGDSVIAAVKGGYAKGSVNSIDDEKITLHFSSSEVKDSVKAVKYSRVFLSKGSFEYNEARYKVGDIVNVMYVPEGYSQTVLGTETPCKVIGINSTKALMYHEEKGDYFEQTIMSYRSQ